MQTHLQCGRYSLPVAATSRPLVMGILNVTPDSFSDAGKYHALDAAISHAEEMIAAGVDIIDIGGESTRPGSQTVSLQDELDRVMPLVYALRDCGKPLSIDTYKPEVMRQTIAAGVDMVNDVNGFRAPGALEAVADADCALCIMHMQKDPQSMQLKPEYENVVADVTAFLHERIAAIAQMNIARERLCIDPGFGFGKSLAHNIALLKNIGQLQAALDLPLLAGLSRKSMIGALLDKPVERRMAGSLAGALACVAQGARIVRVHDVAETVDALTVWHAINQ
ncbi:Dihydropteroate synthase (DHPS) (Dihydropteroate pyrophosphorylase) [Herminiimonas arsenicoxydans]|uniref:Dihydropteroate synthase n=1 Tax=Herminiimonas arsenicoxydans TaxID=204773 RepID=A4G4B2_HERAR|nr:Dihydropteroate synthase (DHPS) (Dihydropteroate pyrophosphorylase) [Herminiimonas arsenicoxydans]